MKLEWKTCFRAGVSIFLLYLCIHYWPSAVGLVSTVLGAAAPLLIGGVIAYLVNILMSFYERHYFPRSKKAAAVKSRRFVCMILAMVTLVAVLVLVVWLVVPQLISCVQVILAELPGAINNVVAWMDEMELLPENILDTLMAIDWRSRIGQIIEMLTSGIGSVMDVVINTVTSVFSGIVTGLLSLIFSVYLLTGKEKLGRQVRRLMDRYVKESWCRTITHTLEIMDDSFHRYIVGQCLEAVVLGVLCALGMMILRLPYAMMVSALVAFTSLIPVAGGYIGAGVGAFMIFTVSPMQALVFLIFIVVLQQVEANVIYPRLIGSSMGLPGIWVLAAVTIGGGIMGIAGMLLGVPLAATAYRLLREDLNKGEQPEEEAEEAEKP